MSGFVNPLAPKRNLVAKTAQIKTWVRKCSKLGPEVVIAVTELACREENCPDIETVIGIMRPGEKVETLRIHGPVNDVGEEEVVELGIAARNRRDKRS